MEKLTFDQWMHRVDLWISDLLCGFKSEDLPDCNYSQWHEDGFTPKAAAKKAIKKAGQF